MAQLLVSDVSVQVFHILRLIWLEFYAHPYLGFIENGHCPVTVLMSQVRGEGLDWLDTMERKYNTLSSSAVVTHAFQLVFFVCHHGMLG